MIINLTAPEVHPPQQIELSEDGANADLWGLAADGSRMTYLGLWSAHHGVSHIMEHQGAADYCWYLGWAFRDIAEAARWTATLLMAL